MSIIRCEYRLLKSSVCRAEGIDTLDSLLNPQHLNEVLDKSLQQLVDYSRRFGLGGESTFRGDLRNILERTILANDFRVTHLAEVIAGIGGIEKVLEFMGGQEGFNLWLNSIDIHRQKKSRIRNEIQQLLNIASQINESSIQVDVWGDFANWLEI